MSDGITSIYEQLYSVLTEALEILPDKPEETPAATLKALWSFAAGQPLSAIAANNFEVVELDDAQLGLLNDSVQRRLGGTPLAHITGRQQFMGLEMLSSKAALIPRKETEILANLALKTIDQLPEEIDKPRVIDVCTGSGNLALAVLNQRQGVAMWGSDLSEDAVDLARKNAEYLGLSDKVQFFSGDLMSPFDSVEFHNNVDVIICNPPYILSSSVQKMPDEISAHEPELAFDGGAFGIEILDRMIKDAKAYLKNGGWLCIEIGAGQGPFVERRIRKSGAFDSIESVCDSEGVVRAIRAQYISQ